MTIYAQMEAYPVILKVEAARASELSRSTGTILAQGCTDSVAYWRPELNATIRTSPSVGKVLAGRYSLSG